MKYLFIYISALFLFLACQSQTLDRSNPRLLFNDHAEKLPCVNYSNNGKGWDGYWTYTGGSQNTCEQHAAVNVTLSTEFKRAGSGSYKHRIDNLGPGNNNNQYGRGEWGVLRPEQQTLDNEWRWAAISIMVPPENAVESRRYQIGFDHKEIPDDLETPFWLGIQGSRYVLSGRFVDDPHIDLGEVEPGVWVDWLLERNWKADTTGYMRFYKNGKLVWSRESMPNIDTRPGSAPICRLQQGLYLWMLYPGNPEGIGIGNTTGNHVIYTDEIKFGGVNATFEDMQIPAPALN